MGSTQAVVKLLPCMIKFLNYCIINQCREEGAIWEHIRAVWRRRGAGLSSGGGAVLGKGLERGDTKAVIAASGAQEAAGGEGGGSRAAVWRALTSHLSIGLYYSW